MKKLTCFGLLLTVFYGCKHDCCDVAQRWAQITALKNGVAWNPQYVNGIMTDLDSIKIAAVSGTPTAATFDKTDTLNIKLSYIGTGTYNLNSKEIFYATFNNGATTSYSLDPNHNNQLKITSYIDLNNTSTTNPNAVEVKGTFDIKFVDPNNPAGINISNATFYVVMQR